MQYRLQRMAQRKRMAVSLWTSANREGMGRTRFCRLDSETGFAEERKQR